MKLSLNLTETYTATMDFDIESIKYFLVYHFVHFFFSILEIQMNKSSFINFEETAYRLAPKNCSCYSLWQSFETNCSKIIGIKTTIGKFEHSDANMIQSHHKLNGHQFYKLLMICCDPQLGNILESLWRRPALYCKRSPEHR